MPHAPFLYQAFDPQELYYCDAFYSDTWKYVCLLAKSIIIASVHIYKLKKSKGPSVNTSSSYFCGPRERGEGVWTSENIMLEEKPEEIERERGV